MAINNPYTASSKQPDKVSYNFKPGEAQNIVNPDIATQSSIQPDNVTYEFGKKPITTQAQAKTIPIPGYKPPAQTQAVQQKAQQLPRPTVQQPVQSSQAGQPWQQNLASYSTLTPESITAAQAEKQRAAGVYQTKLAAGDVAGAQAAHTWANQIRQAQGMREGIDYNPETGEEYNSPRAKVAQQQAQDMQPTTAQTTAQKLPETTRSGQILNQLNDIIQKGFSYDPQSDPVYKQMVDAAARSTFESMNARGLLNSTITRDQAAQEIAGIVGNLMNQAYQHYQGNLQNLSSLYNAYAGQETQQYQRQQAEEQTAFQQQLEQEKLSLQQKQDDISNALNRVKTLGYVDNQSSIALGVPVNTPSADAQQFAQSELDKLQIAQANNQAQAQRLQYTQQQIGARTQYTQGQIAARQAARISATGTKSTNTLLAQAKRMAQSDPRLNLSGVPEEGKFSLDELTQAYYQQLSGGGTAAAGATGISAADSQFIDSALSQLQAAQGTQEYANAYSTATGVLTPAQVLEQNIRKNSAQLTQQGYNVDQLINEIHQRAGTSQATPSADQAAIEQTVSDWGSPVNP